MKFEFKDVKKVVFVVALTSIASTQAKMMITDKLAAVALVNSAKPSQAALKKLAACIKAAKGKKTLMSELITNQFNKIADAFKDVKSKTGAWAAYYTLDATNKKLVDVALATDGVQDHLMSIVKKP
jgi:hypothetical protein